MARLIVKSPYIKCGGGGDGAGGYACYIGTRERVEIIPDDRPPTRRQEQIVRDLERDFPDTMTYPEHIAYAEQPTKAKASEYIHAALETHWEDAQHSDVYMRYIATRPRAERLGSHGLFGDEDHVDLSSAMEALDHYTGNVWTHIISLTREDATRLGYDNAFAWRDLLRAHRNDIAAAMHIPPNDFRWYAAFHDEGNHPHVHMMAWSVKPGQAYLKPEGIRQIRSQLANDVFKQEMLHLYEQKSVSRDEVVREARRALVELAREMQRSIGNAPQIETQMQELAQVLSTTEGKHKYGYLKKPVKEMVDGVVDRLDNFPVVHECYDRWLELQNQVDSYYKDEKRKRLKLSQQKEFRQIKNAVIAVADQINMGEITFEDESMRRRDEPDEFAYAPQLYHQLRDAILDRSLPLEDRDECAERMIELADDGDRYAQYFIGKLYRDGGLLTPDTELARRAFEAVAKQGLPAAQYALGKLLLSDDNEVHNAEEGMRWLEAAAQGGVDYAAYLLGKEYLSGKNVERDAQKAVAWFRQAAEAGNPFAQYALGKLYLDGALVQKDVTLGMTYMEQAAQQGHAFAQFFLNRQDTLKPTSVMLSVTQLLFHMGQIFRDNSLPQSGALTLGIDHKRMQKLIDQKGYQAAQNYARELQEEQQYSGQTMATPW